MRVRGRNQKSSFICEECYREGKDSVVRLPTDRFVVNVAIWSQNNQRLLHRIPMRRLCRRHADEFAANVRQGDVPVAMELF